MPDHSSSTDHILPKDEEKGLDFLWDITRENLLKTLGEATYISWIKPLNLHKEKSGEVCLVAPNKFSRDWLENNLGESIKNLWNRSGGQNHRISFKSAACLNTTKKSQISSLVEYQQSPSPSPSSKTSLTQNGMTFENFVVGEANEIAFTVARHIAKGGKSGFNPLFLYGSYGLGKTHLLNAMAHGAAHFTPNRRVKYLTAERFLNDFISSLRARNVIAFKEGLRGVDMLFLDDIHVLAGKTSTQEEFLYTLEALMDDGRQIALTADRAPSELEGLEPRLKSYLSGGLVCQLFSPHTDLRRKMLDSRIRILESAAYPGLLIDEEVRDFLATRIQASPRELFGALNCVIAQTTMLGRPVTLESAEKALESFAIHEKKRITVSLIQQTVASYYGLDLDEMLSKRRARAIARPRQLAMALSKNLTTSSLPDIGRRFGGRDHTTVIHAVQKIEELMRKDETLNQDIENIRRVLTSG